MRQRKLFTLWTVVMSLSGVIVLAILTYFLGEKLARETETATEKKTKRKLHHNHPKHLRSKHATHQSVAESVR